MSRLLIGNFDFEWSLTHPRLAIPDPLRRLSNELACTWLAMVEPEDWLLLGEPVDDAFWHELQRLVPWGLPRVCQRLDEAPGDAVPTPWGWTERVVVECRASGVTLPVIPPVEVVRRVNSREFSWKLEQESGWGLPDATLVTSVGEVLAILATRPAADAESSRWVVKANLCNSGRERLLGRGASLSDRDRSWLEQRLRQGPLVWEPWVEIVDEVGVQWDVPAQGEPRLLGITPLLTDAAGHYRGSVLTAEVDSPGDWAEVIEPTRWAALRIQREGYFGPLGIDAARYRLPDGTLRLRPLQDINARWTMGRLSLGWRRLLGPTEFGVWRHGPPEATLRSTPSVPTAPPLRRFASSPRTMGGRNCLLQHRVEIHQFAGA